MWRAVYFISNIDHLDYILLANMDLYYAEILLQKQQTEELMLLELSF